MLSLFLSAASTIQTDQMNAIMIKNTKKDASIVLLEFVIPIVI
jgi:hypothetical protein